jgi:hypothetical protein
VRLTAIGHERLSTLERTCQLVEERAGAGHALVSAVQGISECRKKLEPWSAVQVHAGGMRTRVKVVIGAVALLFSACDSRRSEPAEQATPPPALANTQADGELVDLSTSLEAARTAFNAHRGEARFLTLLSPT